jgi:hypothetical protein
MKQFLRTFYKMNLPGTALRFPSFGDSEHRIRKYFMKKSHTAKTHVQSSTHLAAASLRLPAKAVPFQEGIFRFSSPRRIHFSLFIRKHFKTVQ